MLQQRSEPHIPPFALLGGIPSVKVDLSILAVFIVIFLAGLSHAAISFIAHALKGRFQLFSLLLFLFAGERMVACIIRVVQVTRPFNVRLGVASQVLVNAGTLLIYIVNLILAKRVLHAKQPCLARNKLLRKALLGLAILVPISLIMSICSIVLLVYTLNRHTQSICRDLILATWTYFLVFVTIPLLLITAACLLHGSEQEAKVGKNSMRAKVLIIILSSLLCIVRQGFLTGSLWEKPRSLFQPAWFDSKACFYVFNFGLETCMLVLFTVAKLDDRFSMQTNVTNMAGEDEESTTNESTSTVGVRFSLKQ